MSDRAQRDRLEALQLERRALEEELNLTASREFTAKQQTLLERAHQLDADAAPLADQEQAVIAELARLREENVRLRAELRHGEEQSLPGELVVLAPVFVAGLVWAFNQGLPPLALVGAGAFTVGLLLGTRLGSTDAAGSWAMGQIGPSLGAAIAVIGALFVGAAWATHGVSFDVPLSFRNSELVEHLTWTHVVQLAVLLTVLSSTKDSGRLPLVLSALAAVIIAASWYQWVPPTHAKLDPWFWGDQRAPVQEEPWVLLGQNDDDGVAWRDPIAARLAIIPTAGLLSLVALMAFFGRRDGGRRHWLAIPLLVLTVGLVAFFVLLFANPNTELPLAIIEGFGAQALIGLGVLQWVWVNAPAASRWRRVVLLFPIGLVALVVMDVLISG